MFSLDLPDPNQPLYEDAPADRPMAGASGDSRRVLNRLIERHVRDLVQSEDPSDPIRDRELAERISKIVGKELRVDAVAYRRLSIGIPPCTLRRDDSAVPGRTVRGPIQVIDREKADVVRGAPVRQLLVTEAQILEIVGIATDAAVRRAIELCHEAFAAALHNEEVGDDEAF